jgi:hypothetical protein
MARRSEILNLMDPIEWLYLSYQAPVHQGHLSCDIEATKVPRRVSPRRLLQIPTAAGLRC